LPESAFVRPLHRLMKNTARLPANEPARAKRPAAEGKLGTRLTRSNSEAASISIQDIWGANPRQLRKNSCDCEACGGEKLAKRILFTSIPTQETQPKDPQLNRTSALSTLIRNCRSGSLLLPILGTYRLSTLLKPVPNEIFISPPATPHLSRFLSLHTLRPAGKGKTETRATDFGSPLHSCEGRDSAVLPQTRGPLGTTPSTTNSEHKGEGSTRSLGNSRSSGHLHCSKFSTHQRSLF